MTTYQRVMTFIGGLLLFIVGMALSMSSFYVPGQPWYSWCGAIFTFPGGALLMGSVIWR